MKIPKFWASAETQARGRRGEFSILKWSWSDSTMAEALEKARAAAAAVAARITAGEPFPDRYAYGAEQPLREEIVEEIVGADGNAAAVITRNAYGALVLNAEHAMFVDMDFPSGAKGTSGGGGGLLARLFGKPQPADPVPPPAEASALQKIESWVQQNPEWGFRIYRTASGMRLIATQGLFDPEGAAALNAMHALGCDPLYVKLCRAQKSFRARLTPKPWRIKASAPPVRFPYPDDKVGTMKRWVAGYDTASAKWATCRFLKAVGNAEVNREVQQIIDVHDANTRAGEQGLNLA